MKNLPDKIYLNLGDLTEEEYKELDFKDLAEVTWSDDDVQDMNVEYVRTDAFIEKACDAYCRLCDTKECGDTGECDWVEKFRKRLMR